jgi:hypothetical protein
VEREEVVPLSPRPRLVSSTAPAQTPDPAPRDAAYIGALTAIASILAVRLLLLLAILGGFVIAVMALRDGGYQAAGVLVAYAVLILIPLVWLESRPRK